MEDLKVLGVMDRRRAHRFSLATKVRFHWRDLDGISHREEGLIRDFSQLGIFVVTNFHPLIGTTVGFDLFFHSAAAQGVRVEAQGHVIRVETENQVPARCGFALETNAMKVFDRTLHLVEKEN